MEINVQASPGVCNQFIDERGKKGEVTVVISPLRIEMNEDESRINITMGCNLWRSCMNDSCYYSLASRQKSRSRTST